MKNNIAINGLKRVRTKQGRTYYYLKGKRVSSKVASDFQRKDSAKRSERAKKSAKELVYYRGKALKKDESFLINLNFKDAIKNQKERRLDKLVDLKGKKLIKNKAELNRIVDEFYKGNIPDFQDSKSTYGRFKSGYEGPVVQEGVKDIAFWLQESAFNNYKVMLFDGSETTTGKVSVLNKLAELETKLMEWIVDALPNMGIRASFKYKFEVGFAMKSLYIDITSIYKNTEKYITDEVRAKASQIKPLKDLTIDLNYS
jgi:hypothetical protein